MNLKLLITILLILIIFLILRCTILEYYPRLIINGYFSLFICFYLITYIFTNSSIFSIIIGLIAINIRIIYRSKNNKDLENYNSFKNILITIFGLVILFFILINYNYINKFKKYYNHILFILIVINLYFLNINPNDENLLCYP